MSEDYYEGAVRRYHTHPPSIGYVDTLARRVLASPRRSPDNRKARKELVEALAGIAEVASSKHMKLAQFRGLERDDLRQEAMCAMLRGLDLWDPQKGTFRTYAHDRAKYAVWDAINSAHLVSIPRQYADVASRGIETNEFVRLSATTKAAARRAVQPVVALVLERSENDDERGFAGGSDPGEIEGDYEEAITNLLIEQIFQRNTLTAREKEVLIAKYGLFGAEKKTELELGKEFGVCPQRIQTIKKRALEKIRVSNRIRASGAARRMVS